MFDADAEGLYNLGAFTSIRRWLSVFGRGYCKGVSWIFLTVHWHSKFALMHYKFTTVSDQSVLVRVHLEILIFCSEL